MDAMANGHVNVDVIGERDMPEARIDTYHNVSIVVDALSDGRISGRMGTCS